ncbi:Uncharacterised protein [Mycobacteroides abscessus subsp. abscessus]|nr:Uncharacterised protein [Mycobacteroides abscessus subsp. abscessus]
MLIHCSVCTEASGATASLPIPIPVDAPISSSMASSPVRRPDGRSRRATIGSSSRCAGGSSTSSPTSVDDATASSRVSVMASRSVTRPSISRSSQAASASTSEPVVAAPRCSARATSARTRAVMSAPLCARTRTIPARSDASLSARPLSLSASNRARRIAKASGSTRSSESTGVGACGIFGCGVFGCGMRAVGSAFGVANQSSRSPIPDSSTAPASAAAADTAKTGSAPAGSSSDRYPRTIRGQSQNDSMRQQTRATCSTAEVSSRSAARSSSSTTADAGSMTSTAALAPARSRFGSNVTKSMAEPPGPSVDAEPSFDAAPSIDAATARHASTRGSTSTPSAAATATRHSGTRPAASVDNSEPTSHTFRLQEPFDAVAVGAGCRGQLERCAHLRTPMGSDRGHARLDRVAQSVESACRS